LITCLIPDPSPKSKLRPPLNVDSDSPIPVASPSNG
jgi:hypothetical protein